MAVLLAAVAAPGVLAQDGFTVDYFEGPDYTNQGVYNQLPTYYPDPRTSLGQEVKHAVATLHNPHYRLTDVIGARPSVGAANNPTGSPTNSIALRNCIVYS